MTRNKGMVIVGKRYNLTKDTVVFFDACGNKLLERPLKNKETIVAFDFIEKEILFILFNTGKYLLIDPYNGVKKIHVQIAMDLFRKDRIQEGKVFENGFAFYTESRKFFFVNNVYDPHLNTFIESGLGV